MSLSPFVSTPYPPGERGALPLGYSKPPLWCSAFPLSMMLLGERREGVVALCASIARAGHGRVLHITSCMLEGWDEDVSSQENRLHWKQVQESQANSKQKGVWSTRECRTHGKVGL